MQNKPDVAAGPPALVLVAHGTRSATGLQTTRRLRDAVAAVRPDTRVELCYLDVAEPTLTEVLAADDRPAVVVPALLSTGYHVQHDIPEAIGARPATLLARHLGPHPLLLDAVLDRLGARPGVATAFVGAGSSRAEARVELDAMARLAAARLGAEVTVLTMADDLPAALSGLPEPRQVLTYLLAEGQFVSTLRAAAGPGTPVGDALGTHPALVELIWLRYDEVLARQASGAVG